jgi:hypothetical protein
MQNLQIQDITTLYILVDDSIVPIHHETGRLSKLSDSEIITILLWCTWLLRFKEIKAMHRFIQRYHRQDFPQFPNYQNFVAHCHRVIPIMAELLTQSFDLEARLRFADSTMIPVCKLIRADRHQVAKGVADFGKNWQGWHFGFKLHASVNSEGKLCGIHFTPASHYDAQSIPHLVKGRVRIIVGDTHYGASVMKKRMWKERGVFILAPPHPKQKKKVAALWQIALLRARPKIESVWDILKEHFHLVSSFPRSIMGYLFHYLRILLAYQLSFAS